MEPRSEAAGPDRVGHTAAGNGAPATPGVGGQARPRDGAPATPAAGARANPVGGRQAQPATGTPTTSANRSPGAQVGGAQVAREPRPGVDGAAGRRGAPQPGQAKIQLPQRPQLAPGVKPAGQMQESAFLDPPWLLEREDSGFVQVTELLYRIAELCDGRHTIEDIAAKVSEATGRGVSVDNVRQLLVKQLLLKGLITTADGKVLAGGQTGRSLLAINLRSKTIDPRLISPIANALTFLYWPPVLIGVLIAAGLAEAWLFFVHGIGMSTREAFSNAGLLFGTLVIIVVATAFHELGHAAALHKGGGTTRGMGVGLYLIYPAFFTDVTDNYRLPRWRRVRTDLGGFYFNLIFALGVMGLFVVTGWSFLLVIVVLLNLSIVHQMLPFIRMDGYWALADLTGIPDFFSHMVAFVRSVVPIKRWQGRRLPPIKSWARVVFALYILITIPILLFLLFMLIQGVPRLLATAWEAIVKQAQGFGQAQAAGDLLGMAGVVPQILILALPVFGTGFMLFNLARRLAIGLWKWSESSSFRRVVAGAAALAVVAGLFILWSPRLPFGKDLSGPFYTHFAMNFRPIAPDERGTIGDVVGGHVGTQQPWPGIFGSAVLTDTATATPVPGTPPADATPDTTPPAPPAGVISGTVTVSPAGTATTSPAGTTIGASGSPTPAASPSGTAPAGSFPTATAPAAPGPAATSPAAPVPTATPPRSTFPTGTVPAATPAAIATGGPAAVSTSNPAPAATNTPARTDTSIPTPPVPTSPAGGATPRDTNTALTTATAGPPTATPTATAAR